MKRLYFDKSQFVSELLPEMNSCEAFVVIPAFKEEQIIKTLESLINARAENYNIGILIVLNHSINHSAEIKDLTAFCRKQILDFRDNHAGLKMQVLFVEFENEKKSGVGSARKIGMDQAAFSLLQNQKENNLIFCLDADSQVQENYFEAILLAFDLNEKKEAASVSYKHPLEGEDFETEVYEAIILYELHLRYFIQAQRSIHIPYAFHTIGSAMIVRANAYVKEGGMNKRKAGEDFYFLHKFISKNMLFEINNTSVIPSPRRSDRVPFGTGKAVGNILDAKSLRSYNYQSFKLLGLLFQSLNEIYKYQIIELNPVLNDFLNEIKFYKQIEEIRNNTKSFDSFEKRFWQYFNGFMLMKCLHYLRDKQFPNEDVVSLSAALINEKDASALDLLIQYRKLQSLDFIGYKT